MKIFFVESPSYCTFSGWYGTIEDSFLEKLWPNVELFSRISNVLTKKKKKIVNKNILTENNVLAEVTISSNIIHKSFFKKSSTQL